MQNPGQLASVAKIKTHGKEPFLGSGRLPDSVAETKMPHRYPRSMSYAHGEGCSLWQ